MGAVAQALVGLPQGQRMGRGIGCVADGDYRGGQAKATEWA